MSIVLARVDDRLIHGQVLEAWVPYTHADCILVANDQVARTGLQKLLMEAAVPKTIRVVIEPLEAAVARMARGELAGRRVLLLFASAADALASYRMGLDFTELNLGNLHGGEGKMRFACTLALAPQDVANLQALEAQGVQIVAQCIPSDRGQSWRRLLQEAEGNG